MTHLQYMVPVIFALRLNRWLWTVGFLLWIPSPGMVTKFDASTRAETVRVQCLISWKQLKDGLSLAATWCWMEGACILGLTQNGITGSLLVFMLCIIHRPLSELSSLQENFSSVLENRKIRNRSEIVIVNSLAVFATDRAFWFMRFNCCIDSDSTLRAFDFFQI